MESIIAFSIWLCLAVIESNAQVCSVPDQQSNGVYAAACNVGEDDTIADETTCLLTCNEGFEVNGESHISVTCTAGVLDPLEPMCTETCTLPNAVNGEYSGCDMDGDNMISSAVTECKLTCNADYRVSGALFKLVTCVNGDIMQVPDAECTESNVEDGAISVTYSFVMMTFAMLIASCIIGVF